MLFTQNDQQKMNDHNVRVVYPSTPSEDSSRLQSPTTPPVTTLVRPYHTGFDRKTSQIIGTLKQKNGVWMVYPVSIESRSESPEKSPIPDGKSPEPVPRIIYLDKNHESQAEQPSPTSTLTSDNAKSPSTKSLSK
jgi:hypothetical protein